MAFPNSLEPVVDGLGLNPYYIQADDSVSSTNQIPWNRHNIVVSAVTNDANDFIVLPAVASVPSGHTITVFCNAGNEFEVRTPAASNTKINNLDSDGTKEYGCTDTQIHRFVKVSNTQGWVAFALTKLGAQVAAVVPDDVASSSSASLSPSSSSSASKSPSASMSPSSSGSASLSPSSSSSASRSPSASQSPSASLSPSSSASASSSASLSPSSSASSSTSASLSPSSSASSSSSASLSPSSSVSRSLSPSASQSA